MITILILSALLRKSEKEVKEMLLRKRLIFIGARAYVTIAFLLFGSISQAQLNQPMGTNPWKYVTPFQYGFVLNDISFIDNNTGLGVGNNGSIAKTTDAGYTWQYIFYKYLSTANQVTLATLNDIHFVTPTIAYAVGSGGLMIKSTDGGITWTQISTPLTALSRDINALHFTNKDTGYIGGAAINTTNTTSINDAPKVYFTRNGGVTWDSLVTPFRSRQDNVTISGFNTATISRIHFVNDSVGYVSGSCGQSSPNYSAILWKIEKGVVKDYSIHRTKFGVSITSGTGSNPIQGTQQYRGLLGINDSLVLISSNSNGIIVRVKTGKNDSTANAVPAIYGAYERGVYEVVAISNTAIPLPTYSQFTTQSMLHLRKTPDGKIAVSNGPRIGFSPDNGTSWTFSYPGVPNFWWSLTALDVTPNGRIVTGGSSGILYDSLQAGAWRTQWRTARPLKTSNNGAPFEFGSLDFADCNNGVMVGSNGTIVKTSDGGKTWINNSNSVFEVGQISPANVIYPSVNAMYFTTFNQVWRSADQGTTNDAIFGETNPNTFGFGVNQFTMASNDRAFVAAYRGSGNQRSVIFRTLNASAAVPVWDTVKAFPNTTFAPQFRNIKFANIDTGYVTGNRGKVYRTIDGGNTWTDVSPDTTAAGNSTANYTALSVVNGKTVFVGGSSRKLFRSTDAGVTWTDLTIALTTPSSFSSAASISTIVMNDANNGYLVAQGNYLLKTADGWATWTYDVAPLSMTNLFLYPKIPGPISNKKLLANVQQQSTFTNSQVSATLLEYGNAAAYNMTTAEASTNSTCTNPTAGTITVTATGGIAPYTYSINGGPFQSSNVFTGLTQGDKTVTIKDAGCAVITKTVNVAFTDNLTLSASNDTTVCAGAPVQLQATATAGATFTWTPTSGLSNPNISNPVATVSAATTFTVRATLNGCVKTEPVSIAIKPNPAVNAGSDKTIVAGDEVQLTGSASNFVSIAWTPSNTLRDPNTLTPVAKPTTTTTYTMTVKNSDNCTSTDDVIITVLPYCVKVMNAFSPNGDGTNDRWIVTDGTGCTNRIKAAVFNRYGQQVFVNENYQNNWDGTFNGKPVPDGTYYYAISYFFVNGRTAIVKGDVTILR